MSVHALAATQYEGPPHDQAAEESVIGILLLKSEALASGAEGLSANDFYSPAMSACFSAICALDERNEAIDVRSLVAELHRLGSAALVDPASVVSLMADAPSPSAIKTHVRQVLEMSGKRHLSSIGSLIHEHASDMRQTSLQGLEDAEAALFELRKHESSGVTYGVGYGVDQWMEAATKRTDGPEIPTGWSGMDKALGGLGRSRLIVGAARPGVGKTSFAAALSLNLAHQGIPVLFVTIEMSGGELIGRMIASESKLSSDIVSAHKLSPRDWELVTRGGNALRGLPLAIADMDSPTLSSIRSAARRTPARSGSLGLVVVDYIQLMSSGRKRVENRQVEVAELSRGLKVLARELEVPVLALSQLNRGVEGRTDKRPGLSDLRESGAIENDADQVLMLYREDLYKEGVEQGPVEVIVAKNRHGRVGMLPMHADLSTGRWTQVESKHKSW